LPRDFETLGLERDTVELGLLDCTEGLGAESLGAEGLDTDGLVVEGLLTEGALVTDRCLGGELGRDERDGIDGAVLRIRAGALA